MERLPLVDPVVVPTFEGRGGFRRRDVGLRRLLVHGPQGRVERMQPVLQEAAQGQSLSTSHRYIEGCAAEGHGKFIEVSF